MSGNALAGARPFRVTNPGAPAPLVMVGDHAGRRIPAVLAGLGVKADALTAHIAWDIGVSGLGRALARALDAAFIEQRYSRLMIDCNRDPARSDSILEISDGVLIPGNAGLATEARVARRLKIFEPYHRRIARELDARSGKPTTLVAVHSFTPALADGWPRPWRFGVLHDGRSAASLKLLETLRAEAGDDVVGDNQPYSLGDTDYTVARHAVGRGLDFVELEVRQDLLADPAAQREMARFLAPHILKASDPGPR